MPHTPGKWTAHIHTGELDGEAHVNADGACIAYVGFGTKTDRHYVTGEEAKANAHLIAAAPELLEMLKHARDIIGFVDSDVSKKISAVIAKAEPVR
jgi:hypothetical protein